MNPHAESAYLRALGDAFAPDPTVWVSEWADQHRWVASDASPKPGKWSSAYTPYLTEVMDALSFANPCREVVFKKSAQVGATEVGLNWLCSIIAATPAACLVALPTVDTARRWTAKKLDKAINATPEARRLVYKARRGGGEASTSREKVFRNGSIMVVGANSSADMQTVSVRALICEEVTEYDSNVQGMGDPVAALRTRTEGYAKNRKIYFVSTPGIAGMCRISDLYDGSDQARYYVPCPHCGHYQQLTWERFRTERDRAPFQAYMVCAAKECRIEQRHKRSMVEKGHWIRCYPGSEEDPAPGESFPPEDLERWQMRQAPQLPKGFFIWRAYSPFSGWDDIAQEWADAKGDPQKEKQFCRQVLGIPFEDRHDLPSEEILFTRREVWSAPIPPEVLFLEASTDCQGSHLESSVWGFDEHLSPFLVEKVITPGKPTDLATWAAHDELMERRWTNAWGAEMRPRSWGIDTGYASPHVYRYCRRHANHPEIRVYALDGRGDPKLPPLSSPTKQDVSVDGRKIGVVQLWPVGAYNLKIDIADSLRLTEQGPDENGVWPRGAMRFGMETTRDDLAELTSEVLEDVTNRQGQIIARKWAKRRKNELFDLAVYARALAYHDTAGMTAAKWAHLAASVRKPVERQPDLSALWTPPLAGEPAAPVAPVQAEPQATAEAPAEAPQTTRSRRRVPSAPWQDPDGTVETEPSPRPERRGNFERRDWFSRRGREERAW
ncbi:phage terminase large subunit family protein [Roseomonas mucosa]|uniref:phage terminase large subunit family protein n=1 Tax=Roseomonas mucosa TaxID=207340 RepID=UPI00384D8F6B